MTQWLTSTAKPLIERTYRTYLLETWKIDRGPCVEQPVVTTRHSRLSGYRELPG
jgi:hypothetical protein